MSKALVSGSLLSGGVGNGRGAGGVAEGGDWGEGERIGLLYLANYLTTADAGAGIRVKVSTAAD